MKICNVKNCSCELYARGWCKAHYKRWLKAGDVRPNEIIGYSVERVARVAEKLRGRTYGRRSKSWCDNISKAKKGRSNGLEGHKMSETAKVKIRMANSGERNKNWKGNKVGYVALHERVRKMLVRVCTHCKTTEKIEAALSHEAQSLKTDIMKVNGKDRIVRYSTDIDDYFPLCRPCHKQYDCA